MPVIMNNPVQLNGIGNNVLENYGAPSMTGAGFIFKFAFERESVHTIDTLKDELDGIVLNDGTVDTKNPNKHGVYKTGFIIRCQRNSNQKQKLTLNRLQSYTTET